MLLFNTVSFNDILGKTMTEYWLCVTNQKNWEVIKEQKIWGISKRNQKLLARTNIGDILVFYVKPKKLGGIFKIITEPFEASERIFSSDGFGENEVFPCRVKLEILHLPKTLKNFEPLVPKLRFIARKEKWNAYLRKPIIKISYDSYKVLEQALKDKNDM